MNAFMLPSWCPELEDRLLFQDRGARQRRHRCVEAQILSNASVHQSSRRKSAKQPQTIREPAGRVAEFWAVGAGRGHPRFGYRVSLRAASYPLELTCLARAVVG